MSRKKKKIYRAICVLVVLAVFVAAAVMCGRWLRGRWSSDTSSAASADSVPPSSSSTSSEAASSGNSASASDSSSAASQLPSPSSFVYSQPVVSETEKPMTGIYQGLTWRSPYARTADIFKHGRDLMLLNKYYELPESFEWQLVYWSNGEPVSAAELSSEDKDRVQAVDQSAYQPLSDMFAAARQAGVPLNMVSGFRSLRLQDDLFEILVEQYRNAGMSEEDSIKKANIERTFPGTSEHNTGLCFDLSSEGDWTLTVGFENTAQFKWLSEHAADYGFILRFPKDKEDITEIMYEPWHYRYVGVQAAKQMKAQNLCLEEYIQQLDASGKN